MNTRSPSVPPAPPASLICPSCGQATRQNKAGFNKDAAGRPRSQRRECQHCGRTYTPAPRAHGYGRAVRRLAVQQYVDGTNFRRIARLLGVAPQSVVNRVDAAHARLPSPPTTREARRGARRRVCRRRPTAHHARGPPPAARRCAGGRRGLHLRRRRKESAFVVTAVERDTRRILSHAVVHERTWDALQTLVDTAPPALQTLVDTAPPARAYFSDGFAAYSRLMYPAPHTVAPGKSQTYSVEGGNAELRHSLARLARRSRCFSRCLWALARAVDLFMYAWNKRQLFRRQYPRLPAHVRDFITDLI